MIARHDISTNWYIATKLFLTPMCLVLIHFPQILVKIKRSLVLLAVANRRHQERVLAYYYQTRHPFSMPPSLLPPTLVRANDWSWCVHTQNGFNVLNTRKTRLRSGSEIVKLDRQDRLATFRQPRRAYGDSRQQQCSYVLPSALSRRRWNFDYHLPPSWNGVMVVDKDFTPCRMQPMVGCFAEGSSLDCGYREWRLVFRK